jgi:hypothetical protein
MKQTQSSDQDHISEQIKIANQLHEKDLRKSERDQEHLAAIGAAEEMGIPASYMEQAATELSARQAARVRQRKRSGVGLLAASVAVTAALGSLPTRILLRRRRSFTISRLRLKVSGIWMGLVADILMPRHRLPFPRSGDTLLRLSR